MHTLKNSLTFVSGSTQGIGLAIARTFVDNGAKVVVHGRTERKSREAAGLAGASAAVWGDLSSAEGANGVLAQLERDHGSVINVSSEAAVKPLPQMIHYSMTKTAMMSISRGLAELTKGTSVRVNSLLPGPTWTGGVEEYFEGLAEQQGRPLQEVLDNYFQEHEPTSLIQRFAQVDEVADAALFLAKNGAVNGSALRVEGGIIRSL